jgi:hypothetical protein
MNCNKLNQRMADNRQITRQYLHLPYCSDLFITPSTSTKHSTSFLFLYFLTARCYLTSYSVLLFASSSLFFLPLLVTFNVSHIALSSLTSHYFILFFSLFQYLFSTSLSPNSKFIIFDVTSQKDFLHLRNFIFDAEVFFLI